MREWAFSMLWFFLKKQSVIEKISMLSKMAIFWGTHAPPSLKKNPPLAVNDKLSGGGKSPFLSFLDLCFFCPLYISIIIYILIYDIYVIKYIKVI
jgi:hypothetical protein